MIFATLINRLVYATLIHRLAHRNKALAWKYFLDDWGISRNLCDFYQTMWQIPFKGIDRETLGVAFIQWWSRGWDNFLSSKSNIGVAPVFPLLIECWTLFIPLSMRRNALEGRRWTQKRYFLILGSMLWVFFKDFSLKNDTYRKAQGAFVFWRVPQEEEAAFHSFVKYRCPPYVYVDASFVEVWITIHRDDVLSVLSRTGYAILYANCPITWSSALQTTINARGKSPLVKRPAPVCSVASKISCAVGRDPQRIQKRKKHK